MEPEFEDCFEGDEPRELDPLRLHLNGAVQLGAVCFQLGGRPGGRVEEKPLRHRRLERERERIRSKRSKSRSIRAEAKPQLMSKRAEAKPAVDDLLAVDAGEEGGPADPHGLPKTKTAPTKAAGSASRQRTAGGGVAAVKNK